MPDTPVPVTLGSPRFQHASVRGCGIVHAWFPPGSTIARHTHDHPTFAVMLGGSFDLSFRRRTFDCTPTSIAVEPAGESHANYVGSGGAEVLVLMPGLEEAELWRPFRPLFDGIAFMRHGGISAMASRLALEVQTPDSWSALAMEAFLLEMLVTASRAAPGGDRQGPPAWLGRIQEMLHEEPGAALRLGTLADSAGVHPGYLARAFRRHFHTSIGEYARRVRLERAAHRLADGTEAIATIAIGSGFADQSHLTRCFKRHFNTTPRSFREAHRKPGPKPHYPR